MNFEVNNTMAPFTGLQEHHHFFLFKCDVNRLGIISDPYDIILDYQVNFEVNNPMAPYRDIIKLFSSSMAHVFLGYFWK